MPIVLNGRVVAVIVVMMSFCVVFCSICPVLFAVFRRSSVDESIQLQRRVTELEQLREQQAAALLALEADNAALKKELEAFDLV